VLRRLIPAAAAFIAAILDTAIIPLFASGSLCFPVTAIVVLCSGLLHGSLYGALYGMIGGLVLDVSVSTPPIMTIAYILFGLLPALYLNESKADNLSNLRFHFRRGATAFALYMLFEITLCVYFYFLTASLNGYSILFMLLRCLFIGIGVVLCAPLLSRLYFGKRSNGQKPSNSNREVKHF